ncbi:hypothetical protein B296_00056969 [Ensete ventricosum]|uniref:Uncharacterized protein n=1 Tax=Ensete ventricosum TaxID=4639 RepID=A0A426XL43_ENSVE|nr:hypothetical protein B296_00056969 [Ensete ventricosum]
MWINSTHRELSRSPIRDVIKRLLREGAHRQPVAAPPQIRFKLFRFQYPHSPSTLLALGRRGPGGCSERCLAPPPPAGPQPPPPDMESDRRPIHGRNPPPCSPPVPPPRVAHMSLTQVSNSVGLERSISNVVGSDAEMPRPESGKDLN